MKNTLFLLLITAFIMSCSKDDDSNGQPQDPIEMGHFSLVLDGAGFNQERYEFYRDTLDSVGSAFLIATSEGPSWFTDDALFVYLPTSAAGNYTITQNDESTSSIVNTAIIEINNNRYQSLDGSFNITDFTLSEDGTCGKWIGNLDINFLLDGQGTDMLNVSGTFDMPSYSCEIDN